MKILICCEFSGIVREQFNLIGHESWSIDLLPTEIPGNHIIGNALDYLSDGWDMMIAFPPCTHLAVSGARWFKEKIADGRQLASINFFMKLANAGIQKIAIENPVGIMSTVWRKPDQIIQPWQFGEDASKRTCLWLKNLPPLIPTKIIKKTRYANQTKSGQNKLGPSENRARERSRTYPGIAKAMAEQWGRF